MVAWPWIVLIRIEQVTEPESCLLVAPVECVCATNMWRQMAAVACVRDDVAADGFRTGLDRAQVWGDPGLVDTGVGSGREDTPQAFGAPALQSLACLMHEQASRVTDVCGATNEVTRYGVQDQSGCALTKARDYAGCVVRAIVQKKNDFEATRVHGRVVEVALHCEGGEGVLDGRCFVARRHGDGGDAFGK